MKPNMDATQHSLPENEKDRFDEFVGQSLEIIKVKKTIVKVAPTNSTILITGESGTGKELIARAIHNISQRKHEPMVVINCGAIPGELLESELFGHEKGAFTGAHRTRVGRFEMADEGIIFLDEIGDMSPSLQVKLLRVLQEQTFERVGGTRSIKVNIRIISATNKNLKNAMKEGTFREDLYYRLNVIPIKVPPLRHRKTDIRLLVDFFLDRIAKRLHQPKKQISDEVMQLLMAYSWPGNIRELENLMERLSVMADNDLIVKDDLPLSIVNPETFRFHAAINAIDNGLGFNEAIEIHQKALLLQALNRTNWVKAKAAELLKMNRTTLVEKIKKMDLESFKEDQEDVSSVLFPPS
jgi:transcriptional regulator with PAS, ATPase and Fis domain